MDPYPSLKKRHAAETVVDSIHVKPASKDKHGKNIPARFDTALINDGTGGDTGLKGIVMIELVI